MSIHVTLQSYIGNKACIGLVGSGGLLYHEYSLYMMGQNHCWRILVLGLAPIFEPTTLLMSPAHHMTKGHEQMSPIITLTEEAEALFVEKRLAPTALMKVISSNQSAHHMVSTEAQSDTCWKLAGESQSM